MTTRVTSCSRVTRKSSDNTIWRQVYTIQQMSHLHTFTYKPHKLTCRDVHRCMYGLYMVITEYHGTKPYSSAYTWIKIYRIIQICGHTEHAWTTPTRFPTLSRTHSNIITSPPEGVARYCFHPVCLSVCVSVCVCVRPIFWYFISQLLEDISI